MPAVGSRQPLDCSDFSSTGYLYLLVYVGARVCVFARDGAGNASDPSNASAVTTSGDNEIPSAPSNLTAGPISSTQVDLAWTAATDNTSVTGYFVYRNGTLIAMLGAVADWSDTTVAPATEYHYEVRARDEAGNLSDPSNSASATTP